MPESCTRELAVTVASDLHEIKAKNPVMEGGRAHEFISISEDLLTSDWRNQSFVFLILFLRRRLLREIPALIDSPTPMHV